MVGGPAENSLGVGAVGLGAPGAHVHGHPVEVLAPRLPARALDGDGAVGAADAVAGAQGGRARGRGALLALRQLLTEPGLEGLLRQRRRVGDLVFQDAWGAGDRGADQADLLAPRTRAGAVPADPRIPPRWATHPPWLSETVAGSDGQLCVPGHQPSPQDPVRSGTDPPHPHPAGPAPPTAHPAQHGPAHPNRPRPSRRPCRPCTCSPPPTSTTLAQDRGFWTQQGLHHEQAPFLCSGGWLGGAPAGLGWPPRSPAGGRWPQCSPCWSRCSSTLTLVSTLRHGFSPGSSLSLPAGLSLRQPAGRWLATGSTETQGDDLRQAGRPPPPIGATPLKGSRLSLLGALSLRSGT